MIVFINWFLYTKNLFFYYRTCKLTEDGKNTEHKYMGRLVTILDVIVFYNICTLVLV